MLRWNSSKRQHSHHRIYNISCPIRFRLWLLSKRANRSNILRILAKLSRCLCGQYQLPLGGSSSTKLSNKSWLSSEHSSCKHLESNNCAPLKCDIIFQSENCQNDRLEVSRSGQPDLSDAQRYCGSGSFVSESQANQLVIGMEIWFITLEK